MVPTEHGSQVFLRSQLNLESSSFHFSLDPDNSQTCSRLTLQPFSFSLILNLRPSSHSEQSAEKVLSGSENTSWKLSFRCKLFCTLENSPRQNFVPNGHNGIFLNNSARSAREFPPDMGVSRVRGNIADHVIFGLMTSDGHPSLLRSLREPTWMYTRCVPLPLT